MEARVVRPLAEGWPDAWNPVALLRLFPAPSADHPPEEAFDAFDKLAARLTPADAAEVTTTDGASTPAAASTGTGTGGGSSSPRTPATRSSSRPSAAGGLDVAPAKKHPMEIDDTASIHSGGSMAAHTLAMAAARVDLEGGYVAYVVSDELLPEEVRSRVTAPPPRSRDGADSRPAALAARARRRATRRRRRRRSWWRLPRPRRRTSRPRTLRTRPRTSARTRRASDRARATTRRRRRAAATAPRFARCALSRR